jgi:hypothetical protein
MPALVELKIQVDAHVKRQLSVVLAAQDRTYRAWLEEQIAACLQDPSSARLLAGLQANDAAAATKK